MKTTNVPKSIKIDFDYSRFLMLKAMETSKPFDAKTIKIAVDSGIKFDKRELSVGLNISFESEEILEATFGGVYYNEALKLLDIGDNFARKFAEIYKERLDKIDNIISKNKELKNRRGSFIKSLDSAVNSVLNLKIDQLPSVFRSSSSVQRSMTNAVNEHFKIDHSADKNKLRYSETKIKKDIRELFNKMMKDIQNGVPLDIVENTQIEDAEYIKSYKDVEELKKIAKDATKMMLDTYVKLMDYFIVHQSKEQSFFDIKNLMKIFNYKLSQSEANDKLKRIFANSFNFDELMTKVENKLLEDKNN